MYLDEKNARDIVCLYNSLYLYKYSILNPQFTSKFIENTMSKHLMTYYGFRKEDVLIASLGYFCKKDIMTTPIFGYDINLPKEYCLYKRLMGQQFLEAERHELMINLSSGASSFKIYRGAKPSFEYTAVYCDHLPLWRRLGYKLVEKIINFIAIPIIKRNEL